MPRSAATAAFLCRRFGGALCCAMALICISPGLAQNTFLPELEGRPPSPPLPVDPALSQGSLPNGVRYIIRRHATPADQVVLRLRIGAGVVQEEDNQIGAAVVLAHVLQSSLERSSLGKAIDSLTNIIPVESRPDPMHIGADTTEFTVLLPIADEDAVFGTLSALARHLDTTVVSNATVEAARPALLEEARRGCPLQMRILSAMLPQLAPGWRPAERTTCLDEHVLCELGAPVLADFHRRWYSAGNITIIAVGDMPPASLARLIAMTMGGLPAKQRPSQPDLALRTLTGPRAAVVSDPAPVEAVAELVMLEPGDQTVRDESALRDALIDEAAARAVDRRLRDLMDAGDARFKSAGAWIGPIRGQLRATFLTTTGPADEWRALAAQALDAAARIRATDFTDHEAFAAAGDVIAAADQDASREGAMTSLALVDRIGTMLTKRQPLMAPLQRAELARRLLDNLMPQELTERVARRLDPRRMSLALVLPSSVEAPTPDQAAQLLDAVPAPPAPAPSAAGPETLLSSDPPPGQVERIAIQPAAQVTTIDLSSHIRVHHRATAARPGEVIVVLSIAGGSGEESPTDRGLASAAASIWDAPAARSRSGLSIRRAIADLPVTLEASLLPDRLEVRLTTTADALEPAMQLLHLLLSEPLIEEPAFERWKFAAARDAQARALSPSRAADQALASLFFPGDDPRRGGLEPAVIASLTPAAAQAWLDDRVSRAPIEAAIVGEVPRDRVLDLAARYLGSIPPRQPLTPGQGLCTPAVHAPLASPEPRRVASQAGGPALVLIAVAAPITDDAPRAAARAVAARIVAQRLAARRTPGVLTFEVRRVGDDALSGPGILYAAALVDDAAVADAERAIEAAMDSLSANPPTSDELAIAKSQADDEARARAASPLRWAQHLSGLSVRGGAIDDLVLGPRRVVAVSAQEVAAALTDSQTKRPMPRLRVRVQPQ
jgi:zinc protease